MPRDLPLSNGSLHVNFDCQYQLRDVYFPHVGKENHTLGSCSRMGLWVDGCFSWLSDWHLDLRYQRDTMVTEVTGHNDTLGLRLVINDAVDCDSNVLMRRIHLYNERNEPRQVRVFVHFDPHIGESPIANCAYFDGVKHALVFYKGQQYFLLGSQPPVQEFVAGIKGTGSHEGSWRDAEDGHLSNNSVASGYVDGAIMFEVSVPARGHAVGYAWLSAGRSLQDVAQLHEMAASAPATLIDRTARYWRFWLKHSRCDFGDLSQEVADLYRRSLLLIRANIDNGGAIIAANDSDITSFGRDHYSYVWPRDAALVAEALDSAGYHEAPRRFYAFLRKLLTQSVYDFNGYLLHRYTPDGLVASSWHPAVDNGRVVLPIQEDGTALVLYGLCRHLQRTHDVELTHSLYRDFVRPAADFLVIYRDALTGLPQPSHDLWEEQQGIFLFTCSTVCAALEAVADLADVLEDRSQAQTYRLAAAEIRDGVAQYFFDEDRQRFVFMLHMLPDGTLRQNPRMDSSMAGVFAFDLFPAGDWRVAATMQAFQCELENRLPAGGMARYRGDYYHHLNGNYDDYPGNPWFIGVLWLADWCTAIGDRAAARKWLEWCAAHALPSGVMAEQINPHTGQPLSVSPLTWSHAAFVNSVERYMTACL